MSDGQGRRELLATAGGLLAGGLAGCAGLLEESDPDIDVPDESRVGDPFPISLSRGSTVETLTVMATDGFGRDFERTIDVSDLDGESTVQGDAFRDGEASSFVDRSPRSSPGDITDGLGGEVPPRMPLHHLEPVDEETPDNFVAIDRASGLLDRQQVTVEARGDGETVASATGQRINEAPDLEERPVAHQELVGRVAVPETDDPLPGVLVLHGSAAKDLYRWSRRLATHGYAVLTLKYFGEPGLPATLDDVPLEYFDRAVEWLAGREGVAGERIGFVGVSRGVEAALLTAANFDGRTVAVGYGGSGLVSYGLAERGGSGDGQFAEPSGWEAAWTRDGDPVASAEAVQRALRDPGADDPEALGDAGIPVEDVDGPVVLYAGRDDQVWPAVSLSEYANRRLDHFDFPHPHAAVAYEGAGHAFYAPYEIYEGPLSSDSYGGTPATNARAAADSWVRTLDYLEAGLRDR